MQIIQLCVIILLYSQQSIAADTINVDPLIGPHYEYDENRNGWYIPNQPDHVVVNTIRLQYPNVPAIYQNFVNQTLSRQPAGVCRKEVP